MSDDTLLIILGNQLFDKKYLSKAKTKNIFMAEDFGLCTEEKYHKQKIFFFLSAMRTFKDEVSSLSYANDWRLRGNSWNLHWMKSSFVVWKPIKAGFKFNIINMFEGKKY